MSTDIRAHIDLIEGLAIDGLMNIRRNLTDKALADMTIRSTTGKLRGLVVGDDNYYWDAFSGTHQDAARELGAEYDDRNRFWVQLDDEGDVHVGWTENNEWGRGSNRAYLRLMQSPILLFDGGGIGDVLGREILKELE